MAIKYIPANKNEIQLFRRNHAIKENNRQEITDNSLIALRKVHLLNQKRIQNFIESTKEFNVFIKKQKQQKLVEIIRYYLADI